MNIGKTIQSAFKYYKVGNFKQSVDTCNKVLKKNPKSYDALRLLGTIYYQIRGYDNSGHITTSYAYEIDYTNALAPKIELIDTPYPNPLDLNEGNIIQIRINATDSDGIISSVTIEYKFHTDTNYTIAEMSYDSLLDLYIIGLNITEINGTLEFKIKAIDNNSLITETNFYNINYINGKVETEKKKPEFDLGMFLVILGSSSIIGAGIGTFFYRKYKLGAANTDD